MTELETAIRDALHARADAVEPRRDALRPRRPRSWQVPLAAALVLALAVTISIALARRSGSGTQPGASAPPAFVGYRWTLQSLDSSTTQANGLAPLRATIGFGTDGYLRGDDTVNALFGTFRVTSDGYTVIGTGSTLVGYVGHDRVRLAVISAMDSALSTHVSARAHVAGDRLTLTTSTYVLSFVRAGRQPNQQLPPSATSTPS